jgi:hypothetical protein
VSGQEGEELFGAPDINSTLAGVTDSAVDDEESEEVVNHPEGAHRSKLSGLEPSAPSAGISEGRPGGGSFTPVSSISLSPISYPDSEIATGGYDLVFIIDHSLIHQ